MLTTLSIITTVWGVIMSIAPIFQIRVILKTKDSSGISAAWVTVLFIGYILWFSLGAATGSLPLMIANGVALATGSVLLWAVFTYRVPSTSKVSDAATAAKASQ
nr:SemiSWEET family transporter [Arcanobacterium pluranimalium]